MNKSKQLKNLSIASALGALFAICIEGSAQASMITARYKATISPAEATAINAAGGLTDVDLLIPNKAKKPSTRFFPFVRYTPLGAPGVVIPGAPTVTNPDPRPVQGNMNFSYAIPPAFGGPVVAGEMYEVVIGPLRSNFVGSRFFYTTPLGAIPASQGRVIDTERHRPVQPSGSFLFPLNLSNSRNSPLVITNYRIFSNVDFGQTNSEEATNEIANFFNLNNELFDSDGTLLIEPPGREIDVNALLTNVPEYDSNTEMLTLEGNTSLDLPPFLLDDDADTGIVMTFARIIFEDPQFGTIVSDIALGHQVSQIAPVPEYTSTFNILTIGTLGLASILKRKHC